MARRGLVFTITLAATLVISVPSRSQAPRNCEVAGFRGLTTPGGARTSMHVVNNGEACAYTMQSTGEPFLSGAITAPPAHTPAPGYAGTDSFTVSMEGFTAAAGWADC